MAPYKIWLSPPHMSGNEIEMINDAIASNWIAPLGPCVDGFESDIAAFLGTGKVLALNSGTAAMHLALIVLGIRPDDYVICPSFTFSATANPIIYQHAVPVFIDSEEETWNMDPELLEKGIRHCLEKGKKPAAILAVHLYGMPARMDALLKIAMKYDIPLVEDAAESLGSEYHGRRTGTLGKLGVLSFNGNKIITTSGGGALVSEDEVILAHARHLSTQARDPEVHYQHSEIGYNYRLSNICAAIGRAQMSVLEQRVREKRAVHAKYRSLLSEITGIRFQEEPRGTLSNRWLTTILLDDPAMPGSFRDALLAEGIESRPLWKPLHLQPVFDTYPAFVNGKSASFFPTGIALPSGSALTDAQIEQICSILIRVWKSTKR